MIEKYIGGRRCAILGLGVSHTPLARLLNQKNISLTVYDGRTAAELGKEALELEKNGVSFIVSDKDFDGVEGEVIFRSPGIRPDRRGLLHAVENGAELISETELFLKLTPASTYAVTGSDGKTTTTTLVGKFLSEDGGEDSKTYVGGNIGTPLVTLCPQMSERDNAVLELSSFQLMTLSDAPRKVYRRPSKVSSPTSDTSFVSETQTVSSPPVLSTGAQPIHVAKRQHSKLPHAAHRYPLSLIAFSFFDVLSYFYVFSYIFMLAPTEKALRP